MYRPNSIEVAGSSYKIVYKRINDFGRVDTDKKIIYISTLIKEESVLVETLLHEVIHIVLRVSGLYFSLLDSNDNHEEGLVRALESLFLPTAKQIILDVERSEKT